MEGQAGSVGRGLRIVVFGQGGQGEAVEGGVDVGAQERPGVEAGVGTGDGAVTVEQEGGGDGADGVGTAEGGDDGGIGEPDGEGGAERGGFLREGGGGAGIGRQPDHGESAAGVIGLQGVPFGDGGAAGGVVGTEEHQQLDPARKVSGLDFAKKFINKILMKKIE